MDRPRGNGWLEAAINGLLALDPDAVRRLSTLEGKTVRVRVVDLGLSRTVDVRGGRLEPSAPGTAEPDAVISGGAATLARLLASGDVDVAMADDRFEVSGDPDVLDRLLEIHHRLDVDGEELLSRLLGDVAAHQVGNLVRDTRDWARERGRHAMADLGDYLSEEAMLVATGADLDRFREGVAALDAEIDSLAGRVDRLRRQVAERGP